MLAPYQDSKKIILRCFCPCKINECLPGCLKLSRPSVSVDLNRISIRVLPDLCNRVSRFSAVLHYDPVVHIGC